MPLTHLGAFVALQATRIDIPESMPKQSLNFVFISDVGGRGYQFEWNWNAKYLHYSLSVIRDDNEKMLQTYVVPGEHYFIRNFNDLSPDLPDARITVGYDRELESLVPPNPGNLGEDYHILVHLGRAL